MASFSLSSESDTAAEPPASPDGSLEWLGEWITDEGRVLLYDRPGSQEAKLVLVRPGERSAIAEVFHAGGVVRVVRWFGAAAEFAAEWREERRAAVAALIAAYAAGAEQ